MTTDSGLRKVQAERFKSWRETERTKVHPAAADRPVLVHGLMKYLFDENETPYLDFSAGHATLPLGHSYPGTTSALTDASRTFFRTGPWGEDVHGEQMEYLHWLAPHFPEDFRFQFLESENEAIRHAVRVQRGRLRTYVLNRRTMPYGVEQDVAHTFSNHSGGAKIVRDNLDHLGALYVCPIDPDTFEVLDQDAMNAVYEAHEAGKPIIWDATVDSFGWNGDMFRFPDYADYVVLGGALGGGLPLGAVVGRNLRSTPELQGRAGAFGGNSLAFAAGRMTYHGVKKNLDQGDHVYLAEKLDHELEQLRGQFPHDYVGTTGTGLLRGLICRSAGFARLMHHECRINGALVSVEGKVIRVVVPLVYQKADLEELASILLESTMKVREHDGE